MNIKYKRRWYWVAVELILVAAVLYCSWPLGFWLNPVATRTGLASELGALGQPYNWFFIWDDIVSGVFLLAASIILIRVFHAKRWAKLTLVLLAIYGVCGALDAALPLQCLPSVQVCGPVMKDPWLILHGSFDLIGSTALLGTLFTAWRFVRAHNPDWLQWIYVVGGGGAIFALLSLVFILFDGPGFWAQRYYITLSSIWVISIPFVLRNKRGKI
jgi:hypothetical protein